MVVSFRSVGFFLFICWHQRLIRGLCVSQVHSERIGLLIVLLFFCLQKLESGRRLGGEMCWWMAFSALKLSNPVTSFFFRAGGEGRGGGKWEETNCFSSSQNDSSFWDSLRIRDDEIQSGLYLQNSFHVIKLPASWMNWTVNEINWNGGSVDRLNINIDAGAIVKIHNIIDVTLN